MYSCPYIVFPMPHSLLLAYATSRVSPKRPSLHSRDGSFLLEKFSLFLHLTKFCILWNDFSSLHLQQAPTSKYYTQLWHMEK